MKEELPIKGEILARHSGATEREWNSDYQKWLLPGDMIVRDEHGDYWRVNCRPL
jgi:acyl-coenzyme A synthetase/AMP-(fatty) acid ligase